MSFLSTLRGSYHYEERNPALVLPDITNSLSRKVRYNGHLTQSYSVAQHSVHVAEAAYLLGATPLACLAALIHDWPEAFLVDWPAPMKAVMPKEATDWLRAAEEKAMHDILESFKLPTAVGALALSNTGLVSLLDKGICIPEATRFQRGTGKWTVPKHLDAGGVLAFPENIVDTHAWSPESASDALQELFWWLLKMIRDGAETRCPTRMRFFTQATRAETERYGGVRNGALLAESWAALMEEQLHTTFSKEE